MRVLAALLLASFAGSSYLARAVLSERSVVAHLQADLRTESVGRLAAEADRRAFQNTLARIDLDHGIFLSGLEVAADSFASFSGGRRSIIYLMDPDCEASAANIPLLNRLNGIQGTQVLAVSFHNDPARLASYARTHDMAFPLLASPKGRSVDVMPRHSTPITMLVNRGRVLAYIVGRLDESIIDTF